MTKNELMTATDQSPMPQALQTEASTPLHYVNDSTGTAHGLDSLGAIRIRMENGSYLTIETDSHTSARAVHIRITDADGADDETGAMFVVSVHGSDEIVVGTK